MGTVYDQRSENVHGTQINILATWARSSSPISAPG
jgi:hypothetical protein